MLELQVNIDTEVLPLTRDAFGTGEGERVLEGDLVPVHRGGDQPYKETAFVVRGSNAIYAHPQFRTLRCGYGVKLISDGKLIWIDYLQGEARQVLPLLEVTTGRVDIIIDAMELLAHHPHCVRGKECVSSTRLSLRGCVILLLNFRDEEKWGLYRGELSVVCQKCYEHMVKETPFLGQRVAFDGRQLLLNAPVQLVREERTGE